MRKLSIVHTLTGMVALMWGMARGEDLRQGDREWSVPLRKDGEGVLLCAAWKAGPTPMKRYSAGQNCALGRGLSSKDLQATY